MDERDLQHQSDPSLTPNPEGPIPLPGPHPGPGPGPSPGPFDPAEPFRPGRIPIPPSIHCLRTQPVSGRYEGGEAIIGPLPFVRTVLDLRVDIDSGYPNSPAMNRVSGDLYRVQPLVWRRSPSRVYLESWIIDSPQVEWNPCEVVITGTVRWWTGTHPATAARITVPWTLGSMGPATVRLSDNGGTFVCAKRSPFFRQLELEVDVCQSVNKQPILPSYDTHAHANRPASLVRRTLTIEQAYREAGVDATISPDHTIIDDSAAAFSSWSPAELHDAMEAHYSRFSEPWPAWRMWGLMAGTFEQSSVGGIMFDAAAASGGAGKAPERQGFAVFRGHEWFNKLPAGAPADQEEAWALRHFLYTYVHEAGHAFNLLHSWNKNRPDALSWMNYDWRYDQRNGKDTFWSKFEFRFDDDELIHVRHGNRAAVIMGGDPWGSGGHMEGPPPAAMTQLEGAAPLELILRGKSSFEFMEPVALEMRLRNLTEQPTEIDARLAPAFGTVAVFARRPDGRLVAFEPILCQLGTPEIRTLAPVNADDGSDRYSESVFLGYGAAGFLFDVPGEYLVRAVYQGLGDVLVPSDTLRLRVSNPAGAQQDAFADDFFTHEVGLSLALGGSQSRFLENGMSTLARANEEFPGTMLAARASEALGSSAGRSFFRVEEGEGGELGLVQAYSADPERQIELTDPALATFQATEDPDLNLSYHQLVRGRAEALAEAGREEEADSELASLAETLEARGANEVVLDDIRATAGENARES
jgi:hypothetical protein